jgi:hypothetical protein
VVERAHWSRADESNVTFLTRNAEVATDRIDCAGFAEFRGA